jgi:hypothetical protein
MPTFCTFCNEEAYLPHCIRPPMCEKHFELANFTARLVRLGEPVTPENVQGIVTRQITPTAITVPEVPTMMSDFVGRW